MAQAWFTPILLAMILSSASLTAGSLLCEDLLVEDCAFSVSSSGARCVLEKVYSSDGTARPECQTSMIVADHSAEWIETDECLESCGLSRMTFGLSTDNLLDSENLEKLCSTPCMATCHNILDLYIKLAAGEGMHQNGTVSLVRPRQRMNKTENYQVHIGRFNSVGDRGACRDTSSTGANVPAGKNTTVPAELSEHGQ